MTRWIALVEAWSRDGSLAERLCLTLAHSLWQFGLLALLAWFVETVGRRLSFAARYNLCLAMLLVGIAALSLTWNALRAGEPASTQTAAREALPSATAEASQLAALDRALGLSESNSSGAESGTPQTAALPGTTAVGASPQSPLAVTTRWIATAYGLGVCLMLGRLARGVWSGQRTMRVAQPIVNGALLVALRQFAIRYKLRVQPRLAAASELAMPCVMGIVRPTILFPLAALNSLSPVELEMILAHELAHVRRRDLWAHLVQRLTEAVLFFNPGMWYVSRRINVLREYCCDELACERLASDEVSPRLRYAQALVHLAELQIARSNRSGVDSLTSLAAANDSPSQLRRRIAVLLGEPVREPLRVSPSGLMALMLLTLALFVTPRIVVSSGQTGTGTATTEASKPEVEGKPAIEKPRSDAVKVLAIGYGDAVDKPGPRWWNADGTPREAPATKFAGRRNPQLMRSPRARQVVFELPDYTAGAAVRFEIKSKSGWSRGELLASELDAPEGKPKILHEVHTISDDDEVMTLRVGRADGEWKTVYSGDAGAVAQGNNDFKGVVFSETFAQGKGSAVVVSHNWHGQEARLIAIDKSGKKHTGKFSSHLTAVETVNQTIFKFPGLKPDEIAEFDFQVQDFTWTTIDNLPANPKPAADAKATISGRIKLEDGAAPTQKGWLYTLHRGPNGNSSLETKGTFTDQHTFNVQPGKLWFTYFTDDFAPVTAGPLDIEPGQRLQDLDLVLRPGVTWHLKFEDEAGAPVVARANAVPFIGDGLSGPVKPLTADASGALSLEHMTQSVAYQLSVSAAGYQSASLNLPTNTVPPNPADAPVVITMRRARHATGVVRLSNGEPARGSQLIIRAEVTPTSGIAHTNKGTPVDDEGRFSIDELADDKLYLVMAEGPDGARVMLPPVVAGQTGIEVKIPPRRDLKVHLIGDLDKLEQRKNSPTIRVGQQYVMKTPTGPSYGDYLGETVDVDATDDGGMAVYKGLIDAPIVVTVGKREYQFDGSESEVTINLDEPPSKNLYQNRY